MTNKTVLTQAQKAKRSSSFGAEAAERPHSLTREVDDLRSDVESAFAKLETHASVPVVYVNNIIPDNSDKKISADADIHGANLLCGQTQASVTIGDITYTVIAPGSAGNSLSVEVTQGVGALGVTFAASKLTVELAGADSTNTQVATAVNAALNSFQAVVNQNAGNNAVVATAQSASGGIGGGIEVLLHISGTSDNFAADVLSASNSSISLKGAATVHTNAPVAGEVAAVMIKNKDNNAMSHPSLTLPTIA
jgi:hypothetical protein